MTEMIVLRLDGEDGFLLVDRGAGTVRVLAAQDVPPLTDLGDTGTRMSGVAEAYALPALPSIPSRKFFRH